MKFPWMRSLLLGRVEEVGNFAFLPFLLVSVCKGDSSSCCHDPSSHTSGAVHSQQGCHSFGPSEPAPGSTHRSTAPSRCTTCGSPGGVYLRVSRRFNSRIHQLHVLVFFLALAGVVIWSTWKVSEPSTNQKGQTTFHISIHPTGKRKKNKKLNFASQTQSHRT